MEAACRGAKGAGGTTIGILPGVNRQDANDYVDHAIATGMREGRNLAIILTADGVIALPGEFGTLSEISFALKYNKPVVSLCSWEVSDRIIRVGTPAEAVEYNYAGGGEMSELACARVLINGLVQGVGFRYFVTSRAVSYEVCGYVRNLDTGGVEIEVEGTREEINKFLSRDASRTAAWNGDGFSVGMEASQKAI